MWLLGLYALKVLGEGHTQKHKTLDPEPRGGAPGGGEGGWGGAEKMHGALFVAMSLTKGDPKNGHPDVGSWLRRQPSTYSLNFGFYA